MPTILVTGFEPFGGLARNPSQEVIAALPDRLAPGSRIVTRLLPVDVGAAPRLALEAADDCAADAVVCLGLAVGSAAIRVERLFANLYEYGGRSGLLVAGAPDGRFSALPAAVLVAAAAAAGVTVDLSMTAGLYVCNALGFMLRELRPELPSGFIHLPMTPGTDQPTAPTVPLETAVHAVSAMLEAIALRIAP